MTNNLLKKALRANALFSALCAADLLLFSQDAAELMGSFAPLILIVLGIGLAVFAGSLLIVSESSNINVGLAKVITVMDIGWVVGSILLVVIASSWLSTTGIAIIGLVSVVVSICAYFQAKGIQLLQETVVTS